MKTSQPQQPGRPSFDVLNIFADTCGAQFGVPEPLYDALCEFAREVWFLAEVRAVSLKRNCSLKINEENGVTCTLRGPGGRVYRIGVTVVSWKGYHEVLDDGKEVQRDYLASIRFRSGRDDYGGYANDYHDWRFFVLLVLRLEGLGKFTHEEICQWHSDHGALSKLFGSKLDLHEDYFRFLPPGKGCEVLRPRAVKEAPKRPKTKKTGL
jgi:hypothetical protein